MGKLPIAASLAAAITGIFVITNAAAQEGRRGLNFPPPDRPVASIISPIWHSEDERDAAKEVPQVVERLGIRPDMTIADIGAGSGYYAIRLSPLLTEGQVIAEDVKPEYLNLLRQKMLDLHLTNVVPLVGEPADPKLPPHSVDRAILIHMYHEIEQPFALLYNLAAALKPGAKVGIVDAMRPTLEHGTPPSLLKCEVEGMGYTQTEFYPLKGSAAYIAVFELPEGRTPTDPARVMPCKG